MKNAKNEQLTTVVSGLKKLAIERQRPLWKRVAEDLEKPTRQRREVNLWKLDQAAVDGELLVVPGKVLGDGLVTKKVVVGAHAFSSEAVRKLKASGCTILSIEELAKKYPDGKNVRIIG